MFEKESESLSGESSEEEVDVEREVASARNRALTAEALVCRAREREMTAMSDTRASLAKFEKLIGERAVSLASLQESRAELQLQLELARRKTFGEESDFVDRSVQLDEQSRAQLRRATAEQHVLREAATEQV